MKNMAYFKILAAGLFMAFPAGAETAIKHLQVEYQTNPLGIDVSKPRFNWQMDADRYGAEQQAYRLMVSASADDLRNGQYVYDSGKVSSDSSVGITYEGSALKPETRYYWKVFVWDETGAQVESTEEAWFETGLLGSGWSRAEWIGPPEVNLSKYRSQYVIDYDVAVSPGSEKAVFVFGARDTENYVSVELDMNGNQPAECVLRHVTDGKETEDARTNIAKIIPESAEHEKHHVRIEVSTAQYALKYYLNIYINGKPLRDDEDFLNRRPDFWGQKEAMFTVYPYPDGDLVYHCRLYSIGFNQSEGEEATFSGIKISEQSWQTVLYADECTHIEKGSGALSVWSPADEVSAPMLRKSVRIEKPIKRARLYATARGLYEFYINGQRVGKDYFNPGWTDYRFRFMYNTFDITSLLKEGENGIGAMLGTGWWTDHCGFLTIWQDQYGIQPSFLGKIKIEYTDGTEQTIVTDSSWKSYSNGPIVENSIQNGEDYDARKEIAGWADAGYDDSEWKPVQVYPSPSVATRIQAYVGSPVRNHVTLTAQSVAEPKPGVYVYDMGQNMVGVPRLTLNGKAGQKITLRYGEMNYPEIIPTEPVAPYTVEEYKAKKGQVYTDNYRSALSTDCYVMKGDPSGEVYEPRFTFHGYRYIEIHGLDEPLPLESVKGIVLESIGEQTSGYETSSEHINRLFQNIVWGQRGNFLTVPTDCPQRDERMGWTGDAQVFARSATYNMNVNPFYTRWLYSVRDNQGIDGSYSNYVPVVATPPRGAETGGGAMGWMEAGIIVPWQMYQQYADKGILEEHYESMASYMNFLERRAVNYIQPAGGFGDWLALETSSTMLTNTAYSAYDALIMEQIAKILGKDADAQRYRTFYENVKKTFNEVFVLENGKTYAPSADLIFLGEAAPWPGSADMKSDTVDTQTSYVLPLQFGLFNEKNKPLAIQHLVNNIKEHNYTLTTGFVGTPYLNLVLSDNGYDDVAYRLFEQTAYPSWLYPVLQGATTIWERWNSYTLKNGFGPVDMNSFNHYSYGAIEEWMIAYSLGIQRDEQNPGYKHILLQPRIGGTLDFIRGHYDSVYGRIESRWEKTDDGYVYRATIPANTTATLVLPLASAESVKFLKGNEGATFLTETDGLVSFNLKAGTYHVRVKK